LAIITTVVAFIELGTVKSTYWTLLTCILGSETVSFFAFSADFAVLASAAPYRAGFTPVTIKIFI
jgi:hypothetical protein